MEYSKTFKTDDRVRHKFLPNSGLLTVICYSMDGRMIHCMSEFGGYGSYFEENLEHDKNAIVSAILKDL